jgi:hypothetical protein
LLTTYRHEFIRGICFAIRGNLLHSSALCDEINPTDGKADPTDEVAAGDPSSLARRVGVESTFDTLVIRG